MDRTTERMTAALHAVLDDLPAGFHAVDLGHSRLVIGPTGTFLLTATDGDPAAAAARLARLAQRGRVLLAARVGPTPFLDTLVVAEWGRGGSPLASVVPPQMLRDTLLSGPERLDADAVERLLEGVRAVALDLAVDDGSVRAAR